MRGEMSGRGHLVEPGARSLTRYTSTSATHEHHTTAAVPHRRVTGCSRLAGCVLGGGA